MTYQRRTASTYDEPSGLWTHTMSQSFLSDYQHCPEKARANYYGETPHEHTDSTALGTAVHAAIAYACETKRDDGLLVPAATLVEYANYELDTLEWRQTKLTDDKMRRLMADMLAAFCGEVLPRIEPRAVEESFDFPFHRDDRRAIWLSGTPDMIDEDGRVWDWKTAARRYEPWEKQRFAVQPSVYCWATARAWSISDLVDPQPSGEFRYCVLLYDGTVQTLDVTRDEAHVDWLRAQCVQVARMIESGIEPWPLLDAGWWCSPVWCGKFGECKGAVGIDEKWTRVELGNRPLAA